MNKERYEKIALLKGDFSKLKSQDSWNKNFDQVWQEFQTLARNDENYKRLKAAYDEKVQQIISKYDKDGKLVKDSFYDTLNEYLEKNHSKDIGFDPYEPSNSKSVDGDMDADIYIEGKAPVYFDETGKKIQNEVWETKESKEFSEVKHELRMQAEKKIMGLNSEEYSEVRKAKEDYENLSFLGKAIVKMKEKKLAKNGMEQDQNNSIKM